MTYRLLADIVLVVHLLYQCMTVPALYSCPLCDRIVAPPVLDRSGSRRYIRQL